ncbi:MAG: sugar ABC transporter permease [Candidatus Limnocylindrales bacterium]|jgi:multiple sugar transport system permease protein
MTSLGLSSPARKGHGESLARREARWGYIFLSPWIVGFLAFTLIPMVATLVFSFTNIQLTSSEPVRFVGLANWQALLADERVWSALRVTFSFAALQLPIAVIVPFLIALLLNSRRLIAPGLFRVLFFMPYTVPFVASVVIWEQMENQTSGWIDQALGFFGIAGPNWLNDPALIYPALVLLGLWGVGGGMIVYLGGLSGIPGELYEAARIDGASWLRQLWHITIPMLSPVFLYTLVLGIVDVLQYFLVVEIINNGTGEPGGTTQFYNLFIYKELWTYGDEGMASALAWLLFLITLAITLLVFLAARRWVYYAGER